jgi:biopolymer transport protein ExbD
VRIPEVEAEDTDLSMAPLIDVVFQLLIFFMVATTYADAERELQLELPAADSALPAERAPEEIVISVLADGGIVCAGRALERAELAALLSGAAQRSPETPVTIRGDRSTRHEAIVDVLDACGTAGLANLAVGTLER